MSSTMFQRPVVYASRIAQRSRAMSKELSSRLSFDPVKMLMKFLNGCAPTINFTPVDSNFSNGQRDTLSYMQQFHVETPTPQVLRPK